MKFDLNMEEVLEAWRPSDAIREVIANALDEQKITNSKDIDIYKENDEWVIRDYGRGFHFSMLTQCENQEKRLFEGVIGQFGCGILDAIGVLYRNNIKIIIVSKNGVITIDKCLKVGTDIETLHAIIDEDKIDMQGTKVIINCSDEEIEEAKSNFLQFENIELLEKTSYGQVYEKKNISYIYVNGIKISEEPNFIFSYNITKLDAKMKKSLNRERKNVGRSSYTDIIQKILCELKDLKTCDILVEKFKESEKCDELRWKNVALKTIKLLDKKSPNIVFLSETEVLQLSDREREILRDQEKEIHIISDTEYSKIGDLGDLNTLGSSIKEYSDSFEYEFIDFNSLYSEELKIFQFAELIFKLLKVDYDSDLIRIAKNINPNNISCTKGVWDSNIGKIVIARSELTSIENFSGVLAHEIIHYNTFLDDISREFEGELTNTIGNLISKIISYKE